MAGTQFLAFIAGLLSILSPCVLPLVPIVFASSLSSHRLGPAALAAGLSLSFTLIGLFLATIGFSLGINNEHFRFSVGLVMVFVGILLFSPALQMRLTVLIEPLGRFFNNFTLLHQPSGLWGQFGLGLLLGAVWSPCVGPTLGAASLLASQNKDLFDVFVTMLLFGLGAALPLLVLGKMTQSGLQKSRYALLASSVMGKKIMGLILIGLGVLMISGWDKILENVLVDVSPDWLIRLTTQF